MQSLPVQYELSNRKKIIQQMTETNVYYTIIGGLIVGLVILLFRNKLTAERDRQRDSEANKRDFNAAASDFDAVVDKWLGIINHSMALAGERTKSKPEIEQVMIGIRKYIADTAKSRLAQEWKNYQDIPPYQLEPVKVPPGVGTSTRNDFTEARNTLSAPLKKMKEIIRHDT